MSEFHKDRELEHMFELQGNNRSGCPDEKLETELLDSQP